MHLVDWNNPVAACEEMRRLDRRFKTLPNSPLHHDNRCQLLHGDTSFDVVADIMALLEPDPWSPHN